MRQSKFMSHYSITVIVKIIVLVAIFVTDNCKACAAQRTQLHKKMQTVQENEGVCKSVISKINP